MQKRAVLKNWRLMLTLLVWAGVIIYGVVILMQYQNKPGITQITSSQWPNPPGISLAKNQPTMLLFMHPYCPCSRATLDNLSRLLVKTHNKVQIYILFFSSSKFPQKWVLSDTWNEASKLPGVHVLIDRDGRIAKQFQASISGQVLLYGTNGHKLFDGGITPSRGHSGDSSGSARIESLILKQTQPIFRSVAVFGCPIQHINRAGRKVLSNDRLD